MEKDGAEQAEVIAVHTIPEVDGELPTVPAVDVTVPTVADVTVDTAPDVPDVIEGK